MMNVGRAITAGMRAQRSRDIARLVSEPRWAHSVFGYWWWGWDINGHGGLGRPGSEL